MILISFATDVVAKEPDKAPFANEITAFEKWDHQNAVPRDAILFVGSSTIRMWQTADAFPDLPIINRGFGGSTIADVNLYADRIVFKYKPRTIVLYAGDNDIAGGRSPDRVVSDFERFAKTVHDQLPETRLIYLAIKPSIARWQLWPKMQEVNSRIKAILAENPKFTYVDTAPALFGPDGQPDKANFREDGLHMSDQGYAAWNKLLVEKLK
jgi:lysophospholipase L1-like esterase